MSTDVTLEKLFDANRFPQGWSLLPLLIYSPFGFFLALVRFFVCLHTFLMACLLPSATTIRSLFLRTMCVVLGVVVTEDDVKLKDLSAKVIVSNHITILDNLVMDFVLPSALPCVRHFPSFVAWLLGYKDVSTERNQDALIQNVRRSLRDSNLQIVSFPEEATTNGRVGLLKFATWPFALDEPVLPIVLKVQRLRLLNIAPSVIGSPWWSDIFWFLFSPYTLFTIRYLPVMRFDESTTVAESAAEVQKSMAAALGIQTTNYTFADKAEYEKRLGPRSPPTRGSTALDTLSVMIGQVKEVLPHTSVDIIRRDLLRTNNVSVTIGNLLEATAAGHNPNLISGDGSNIANREQSNLSNNGSPTVIAASTFGRTSNERMASYQERRRHLIETARQRYIQKHHISVK